MTAAGDLDQRITIQHKVESTNGLGEVVTSDWTDRLSQIAAKVRTLRSREYNEASQEQNSATVVFTIRYRRGITNKMRVLWRGLPYAIQGDPSNVMGRNEWLELSCLSGAKDGR